MSGLSLQPDEDMRWIYNPWHPDYHTDRVRDLRNRRDSALRHCPRWMLDQAASADAARKASPSGLISRSAFQNKTES